VPAVQLVAQQTLALVLVSSVTHWSEVHCPLDVQVAPFARSVDVSFVEESTDPVSADEESFDDESMALESWLDESVVIEESPPLPESTLVSDDVLSLVIMPSPSGPSMVPSSRPPSTGILLRSKSTMSSQPPTISVLQVRTAVSRPHLIERFVFMPVFSMFSFKEP